MRRILLVTWDGGGNFPPQRSLVRELVTRGSEVSVLGHETLRGDVEADGATFIPFDQGEQLDAAKYEDDQEWISKIFFTEGYGADVRVQAARLDPDVLVVDIFIASVVRAAIGTGIPTVAFCTVPFGLFETLPAHGLPVESPAKCAVVLCHGYREFDPVVTPPPNLAYIGRMRPHEDNVLPLPRRLPDAPLVLVGLSTTQQNQSALLQRLCAILGRMPVEAICTTGRAVAPESLSAPPNVTLIRHYSHDAILPAASLLITHAGMGTVLAGAEYGVPMLCLPMGRDQPANAGRVADLGLGLTLSPEASDEDLLAAINRLLSDGAIRRRCAEFARGLASHPGVERAADLVEGIGPIGDRRPLG